MWSTDILCCRISDFLYSVKNEFLRILKNCPNAMVTCEIKYRYFTFVDVHLKFIETCLKLFQRIIAAHEK